MTQSHTGKRSNLTYNHVNTFLSLQNVLQRTCPLISHKKRMFSYYCQILRQLCLTAFFTHQHHQLSWERSRHRIIPTGKQNIL